MNNAIQKYTNCAKTALKALNGVFIIYKPAEVHFLSVRETIIRNVCRDLNEMEVRAPYKYVDIEGPTNKNMNIVVRSSYADNPLVVGPRHVVEDFRLIAANIMCQESSGVLICGINNGAKLIHKLKESKLTRFYKLKGILGQARDNNFSTGRIVEKSTWKHIKRNQIDHFCASLQASHQKKMFELSGIDIQSQAAYELAAKGPIRPADPNIPMIYSIKCINFQPPEFTIEIACINENDVYLKAIVSEIGYKLKSTAHCSYIQCAQWGLFSIKDALLSKHWDLQNIISNISLCHDILSKNPYMLKQEHANLVQHAAGQ